MYSEAKVAFFVYLWYPKTRGTSYVYETFFRPCVAKHETEIDRNLLELRTRAGDMVVLYSQRIASYGQTRFFEILQYVASRSPSQLPRPHPSQQRQQPQQAHQATPTTLQPPAPACPPQPPAGPTKAQPQEPAMGVASSSLVVAPLPSCTQPLSAANTTTSSSSSLPTSSDTVSSSASLSNEAEAMQVEVSNPTSNKDSNPPPQERLMEEAIRVTRGKLRKRAATAGA